jgi:non-ribosomal peptide synthetase component F
MSSQPTHLGTLPGEHLTSQAKRSRPTGTFIEFKKQEIEQSIPQRFEQIVCKYPDRLAVNTRRYALTYGALNQTANRVARAIVEHSGEGKEPIAMLFDSDAPMIAAMLGVLKAGKFYVPLDPLQPGPRISFILEDTEAGLIVTNAKYLALAKELARHTLRVLSVDTLDVGLSDANLGLAIAPETPTWILYTSGSTGQPKGVVQTHGN